MKKSIKIAIIVIGSLLIALGIMILVTKFDSKEISVNVYATSEVENVSVTISDISLSGATITIKDTNEDKYTYGEWYVIEKEENGKLYNLPTKVKEYGFNDIGYEVDENNEVKFVIDWEWLYGKLPQGNYRIIKESHDKYISIPFGIAETQSSGIENNSAKLEGRWTSTEESLIKTVIEYKDDKPVYANENIIEYWLDLKKDGKYTLYFNDIADKSRSNYNIEEKLLEIGKYNIDSNKKIYFDSDNKNLPSNSASYIWTCEVANQNLHNCSNYAYEFVKNK